jgi:hypothetical protein
LEVTVDYVIVSNHPADVAFYVQKLREGPCHWADKVEGGPDGYVFSSAPYDARERVGRRRARVRVVAGDAGMADVLGKVVYGDVSLNVAVYAEAVCAIDCPFGRPRGPNYTVADLFNAGAGLSRYAVVALANEELLADYLARATRESDEA